MEEIHYCKKKCCSIKIKPYTFTKNYYEKFRRRRRKAGVFVYDPETKKILLIQSRGHLWGPPKGTLKFGETERMCAVRELEEETGITISIDDFTKVVNIYNRSMYFYIERKECEVNVQNKTIDNDANGISWINIECLKDCIESGNISVTQHCRIVLYRFLNENLPHSRFCIIENKKISRF